MDTTKTAAGIFADQLSAVELLFGFRIDSDGTPGERVSALGELARKDKGLTSSLMEFFSNPVHFANRFSSSDDGIFEAVTRTLFAAAVRGAIHDYGNMGAPKRQHWMPVAYLTTFGRNTGEGKGNRSVFIPGVSFTDGFTMDFETRDATFIHDKVNGAGFYEDSAEYFFHLVEGLYAQGRTRQEREIDHSLVALFFFVQSVRNPRYGERFVHSKLSSILDAILANLDAVGPTMEARFLKSSRLLPFTPYVPPFVDRFEDARIYSLPVGPNTLFSVSTGKLRDVEWRQLPNRYRKAVVRQAQRRESYVFGVEKQNIQEIISQG